MSDEVVAAISAKIYGQPNIVTTKTQRVSYEIWTNKTLVLRTVHETQALRYAKEVDGEVHTVAYTARTY